MATVERKIFFYRINIGHEKSGQFKLFDPSLFLNRIDDMPWTNEDRYFATDDGKITCCWIDQKFEPYRARLGNVRRSDLPQIEEKGKLEPLLISTNAGLVEQTFCIFFPNNIVGVVFNFYGPRVSRFTAYLDSKLIQFPYPSMVFEQLLRQDVSEQLSRMKEIKLIQLRVMTSFINTITRANKSLGDSFKALAEVGEAEEVEIILKQRPRSRSLLNKRLLDFSKALLKEHDLRYETSRFHVEGYDEDFKEKICLDLLNDKLISTKKIVKLDNRYKALNADSAYSEIQRAYKDLYDQINIASGIS